LTVGNLDDDTRTYVVQSSENLELKLSHNNHKS
jgi:hypothetical protein